MIIIAGAVCFFISLCCNIYQANKIKRYKSEILKFQINPHTIKNLLQEIVDDMERVHSDAKSAFENMQEVMELLKEITYRGDDAGSLVSIKNEIEQTAKYIHVVRRFKIKEGLENIEYNKDDVDVQSKYYEKKVIPELIVLPLVENAFMYGDRSAIDFLNIHFALSGDMFEVLVKNRKIISRKEHKSEYSGLGLKNLKERMDLLIGEDLYELNCTEDDEFYCAKLTIKFC